MVWKYSFSQGSNRTQGCGVLWNVLFLPTSSGLGLAAGQTKLRKQFFNIHRKEGPLPVLFQSWVLTLINPYHQVEKHRLRTSGPKDDASVGMGAGGGGGETLPLVHHPAIFSFTAPPLKKGKNWACPTRDEEETLNLNPGNVQFWRAGGYKWGQRRKLFWERSFFLSGLVGWSLFTLLIFFIGSRGSSRGELRKFIGQLLDLFLVGSHPGLVSLLSVKNIL